MQSRSAVCTLSKAAATVGGELTEPGDPVTLNLDAKPHLLPEAEPGGGVSVCFFLIRCKSGA